MAERSWSSTDCEVDGRARLGSVSGDFSFRVWSESRIADIRDNEGVSDCSSPPDVKEESYKLSVSAWLSKLEEDLLRTNSFLFLSEDLI